MKKQVVLVLAAVLASAVSARISQDEISYKIAQSAWHSSMKHVKCLVRSDHPSAEEMLRGAIMSEAENWNHYMFAAERALSSADGRLRTKILERLEKDRNARPQICIDMEKTPESNLQQAKQRARQQQEKQQAKQRARQQQEKRTAKQQTTKTSSSATARAK